MSLELGLGTGQLSDGEPAGADRSRRSPWVSHRHCPADGRRPSAWGGLSEKTLRRRFTDAGVRPTLLDGLTSAIAGRATAGNPGCGHAGVASDRHPHPPDEETCFRCAEVLELPVINVIHYRGPELPLEQMADAVGALCHRAKARGFTVALEFVPTTGLRNLPFTQAVIAASGASNCGITLDFFHLDRTGGTAADIRRLPPGLIANIQVSDRTPSPPGTPHRPLTGRKMPGEGQIPLRELDYRGTREQPRGHHRHRSIE